MNKLTKREKQIIKESYTSAKMDKIREVASEVEQEMYPRCTKCGELVLGNENGLCQNCV